MAESHFAIAYDGPALATGQMAVRDLAPALLALGDLFVEASEIIYPDGGPVALNVKATEQGSFDVHLILEAKGLWDQFVDLFGADEITALVNLQNLIIGSAGGYGLFALIRKHRGKEIAKEEPAVDPGVVRVTWTDGTTVEIPADVGKLYRRLSIRRKARDVVAPLAREGVEEVRFVPGPSAVPQPELVVAKDDLHAFELAATTAEDVLSDDEREMVVQVAAPDFEGRKWRLSEGSYSFFAAIEDAQFLEEVERRADLFGKGDMLRCRFRVIQRRRAGGGLKSEYYVLRVLEHIPGDTQLTFHDDADATSGA